MTEVPSGLGPDQVTVVASSSTPARGFPTSFSGEMRRPSEIDGSGQPFEAEAVPRAMISLSPWLRSLRPRRVDLYPLDPAPAA